jgi:hypothetical protein
MLEGVSKFIAEATASLIFSKPYLLATEISTLAVVEEISRID